MSNPNFQDWNTVVFTKKPNSRKTKTPGPATNNQDRLIVKKGPTTNKNTSTVQSSRLRKLDEAEEPSKIQTVSLPLRQAISRARQDKGLKQKELAALLNVKSTVIQAYESGSAIPDGRLLGQMEKALGVKLRGKQKSQGTK